MTSNQAAMTEAEFRQLLKPDRYQILLLASPIPMPLHFIVHAWLVIVDHGHFERWEVWELKHRCPTSWGYVHLDLFPPWLGVRKYPLGCKKRFNSRLLGSIEGGEESIAAEMVRFVQQNAPRYPHAHCYHYFPGPNSNSFVQAILDRFPESGLRLPFAAVGKHFAAFAKF